MEESKTCACGYEHEHIETRAHEHEHNESCNHGHEHNDTCNHDHEHSESCCHDHAHEHGESCACGHDHEHSAFDVSCGCGHDHGHSHGAEGGDKRFFIQFGIGLALFAGGFLCPIESLSPFVFLASYLVFGAETLLRAAKNILRGQIFDENFLMSVATIGAFAIGEYPEGVTVMLLYQIGEYFQGRAMDKSRKSIKDLMSLVPETARVWRVGEWLTVNPKVVTENEIIQVLPGERIPLDGVIIDGAGSLDTSGLTGESVPRDVTAGDSVLGGSINLNGALEIRVTAPYAKGTAAKILETMEHAAAAKAPTEAFITRFSKVYTPIVVMIAVALAVLPPLVLGGDFAEWLRRALVFLVISCPCALVISVPLTFFAGIGQQSKKGVLVKSGTAIQNLARVDTVVFDKTGTLTMGAFRVEEIHASAGVANDTLLKAAFALENLSNHPIALSVVAYCKENGISVDSITDFAEIPGMGLSGVVGGKRILAGNERLMIENNVNMTPVDAGYGTVLYVASDKRYLGALVLADQIKPTTSKAIDALKSVGVRETAMLTGDRKAAADRIAAKLGIDRVSAELLPHQKVEAFEQIAGGSKLTMFVGDGINDAPVLARSDIGVAMGGVGSDAAMEAADVVIVNDDIQKIPAAIKQARHTMSVAQQNIAAALIVKTVLMLLSATGLFVNMPVAIFADVGMTIILVMNATRKARES